MDFEHRSRFGTVDFEYKTPSKGRLVPGRVGDIHAFTKQSVRILAQPPQDSGIQLHPSENAGGIDLTVLRSEDFRSWPQWYHDLPDYFNSEEN